MGVERRAQIFVAVIHGRRYVHHVVVASSRSMLIRGLGRYVRDHARIQLRAEDSAKVEDLLIRGEAEHAVAFYMDRVGDRWDEEWLYIHTTALCELQGDAPVGPCIGRRAQLAARSALDTPAAAPVGLGVAHREGARETGNTHHGG
jgi:hypothetical protein